MVPKGTPIHHVFNYHHESPRRCNIGQLDHSISPTEHAIGPHYASKSPILTTRNWWIKHPILFPIPICRLEANWMIAGEYILEYFPSPYSEREKYGNDAIGFLVLYNLVIITP